MPELKVRELREQYTPEEVTVIEFLSPRSKNQIFSPEPVDPGIELYQGPKDKKYSTLKRFAFFAPPDTRVEFLHGSNKKAKMLVKNVLVDFEPNTTPAR